MRSDYLLTFFPVIVLTTLLATSCKDSASADSPVIRLEEGSYSVTELNDCSFSSGDPGTQFLFEIDFESSSDIEIDGVEFDFLFESGTEGQNVFDDDFDITGDSFEFDYCFRFGSSSWVEIYPLLLAEDEELESNEITIRIERPEGANKKY